MLVTLGPALVTTEGYSAAEVGETYERALELSRRLDERNIFVILSGAWVFHIVRGDLEKARQFSLEFLRVAEREPTPGLMLAGNFLLGSSLFHLGQLEDVARPYDRGHSHTQRPRGIRAGTVRRTGHRRLLPLLSRPSRVAPGRRDITRMLMLRKR